jgi:hypothetical protein
MPLAQWLSQFDLFCSQEQSVGTSPADLKETQKALDQLFTLTKQYESSAAYLDLLSFIGRFRFYSPYNAMLVHVQMPGATFVASASRWLTRYARRIRTGARPIVILQPKGPVMFVFDVSDTEAERDAPVLPRDVTHPFEIRRGGIGAELEATIETAKRDGIRVLLQSAGSQNAGSIRSVQASAYQDVVTRRMFKRDLTSIPVRYDLLLNAGLSREAQYVTLVHELAHLYCGHLGTPDSTWWPNRVSLPLNRKEFEAESVCYVICQRIGIENPSEAYLHGYLESDGQTPPVSLELVLAASGLIERMGRERLPLRKPSPKPSSSKRACVEGLAGQDDGTGLGRCSGFTYRSACDALK